MVGEPLRNASRSRHYIHVCIAIIFSGKGHHAAIRGKIDRLRLAEAAASSETDATAAVFDLCGRRPDLAVVNVFHFARHDIDHCETAVRNAVTNTGATRDVFRKTGVSNPVGDVRIL